MKKRLLHTPGSPQRGGGGGAAAPAAGSQRAGKRRGRAAADVPPVFAAPLGSGESLEIAISFDLALFSERRLRKHWPLPFSMDGRPQVPRHAGTFVHDVGTCTICSGTHPGQGWRTGVVAPGTPLRAEVAPDAKSGLCSSCYKDNWTVRKEVEVQFSTTGAKKASAPPRPPPARASRSSAAAAAAAPPPPSTGMSLSSTAAAASVANASAADSPASAAASNPADAAAAAASADTDADAVDADAPAAADASVAGASAPRAHPGGDGDDDTNGDSGANDDAAAAASADRAPVNDDDANSDGEIDDADEGASAHAGSDARAHAAPDAGVDDQRAGSGIVGGGSVAQLAAPAPPKTARFVGDANTLEVKIRNLGIVRPGLKLAAVAHDKLEMGYKLRGQQVDILDAYARRETRAHEETIARVAELEAQVEELRSRVSPFDEQFLPCLPPFLPFSLLENSASPDGPKRGRFVVVCTRVATASFLFATGGDLPIALRKKRVTYKNNTGTAEFSTMAPPAAAHPARPRRCGRGGAAEEENEPEGGGAFYSRFKRRSLARHPQGRRGRFFRIFENPTTDRILRIPRPTDRHRTCVCVRRGPRPHGCSMWVCGSLFYFFGE